jgi:hypothetical protein
MLAASAAAKRQSTAFFVPRAAAAVLVVALVTGSAHQPRTGGLVEAQKQLAKLKRKRKSK